MGVSGSQYMLKKGNIAIEGSESQQIHGVPGPEFGCMNTPITLVGFQLTAAGCNLVFDIYKQPQ